jgi:hypothetical protein
MKRGLKEAVELVHFASVFISVHERSFGPQRFLFRVCPKRSEKTPHAAHIVPNEPFGYAQDRLRE